MDWAYQVLSVIIAFGPIVTGIVVWHYVWNRDSGSSSNTPPPPPNGPQRRPVPPPPKFSGDRPAAKRPVRTDVRARSRTRF
jgi:hypothetical protein